MAFYYPEGSFGPICDVILPPTETVYAPPGGLLPPEDPSTTVIGDPRIVPDEGDPIQNIFPGLPRFLRQNCKVRPDGSFYDCEYVYDLPVTWDCTGQNPPKEGCAGVFPTPNFDFDPSFFVPRLDADSCIAWDPEINIKPIKYFTPSGTTITKYRKQKSTPITYPVTSATQETIVANDLTIQFDSTGDNLIVSGSAGNGRVELELDWDDNPITVGTALGKIEVNGLKFIQHYCRNVEDLSLTLSGTSLLSWGSGTTERGGFRKPTEHYGIGNQYIAFGTAGTSPFNSLQTTRTAAVTLDLDSANHIFVYATLGNDKNGGETVNNSGEGLRIVWPDGTENDVEDLQAQQDSGQSVNTFKQRNSKFRYCEVRVPVAFRTSNTTVQFKQTIVNSTGELRTTDNVSLSAFFNQLGDLEITGQGSGTLQLDYDWNDDPNKYGTAVSTINVKNQTFTQVANTLSASFKQDGTGIIVQGSGTTTMTLQFEWNDSYSISGRAVGKLVIAGQTFEQTSSSVGSLTRSFSVTGGQEYLWTITGQSSTAGYRLKDGAIQWDDNAVNGFDKNAEMVISLGGGGNTGSQTRSIPISAGETINVTYNDNTGGYRLVDNGKVVCLMDNDNNDCNGNLRIGPITMDAISTSDPNCFDSIAIARIGYRAGGSGANIEEATVRRSKVMNAGTYPITYTDRAQAPTRDETFTKLKFKDYGPRNTNATFSVASGGNDATTVVTEGYWSDEGNKYAVWVNPEQCTLPLQQQTVTYLIPIPATDTYTITGGSDDSMSVFLNNSSTPLTNFNNAVGGIFAGGSYNTPYSETLTINGGILTLVVKCNNSAAGFVDGDGNPIGNAFNWKRNPGGWYLKICRGSSCYGGPQSPWVKSGPHQRWNALMNKYAAYPSNVETLTGVAHSASVQVNIMQAGNYVMEVSADNSADFTFDGVSIGSQSGFASSSTININNVSIGPHIIGVTVTNAAPAAGNADVWSKNPGGVAYTMKLAGSSTVSASFNSSGGITTTGTGSREFTLDFEWDDNPSDAGTALGTYRIAGVNFRQTPGQTSGNTSQVVILEGGRTYNATIVANSGGFRLKNNNSQLCFMDRDGDDCNAKLDITPGANVDFFASTSLDLTTRSASNLGNLIWNTRDSVGYELTTIASEGGY